MPTSPLTTPDLRRLFLGIVRATAASSCLAACAVEHGVGKEGEPDDEHEDASGGDATEVPDAGVSVPSDAGRRDAGADAGGPKDAGGPLDAGGPKDGGVGPGAWEQVPCAQGIGTPAAVLNTPSTLDHLSAYVDYQPVSQVPLIDDSGAPARGVFERARVGDACANVMNQTSCLQQVAQLKASSCTVNECSFALVGVGAQYTRIDQREQLIKRLGSIDTAAEAVLLAAFDGHRICKGLGTDKRDIGLEIRTATAGGYDLRATWEECGNGLFQELYGIAADGTLTQVSMTKLAPSLCAIGRRAPGACEPPQGSHTTRAAAYLSEAARLEAGSVFAFFQLIRELTAHGAPEALRALALDAMLDEVRHTREVGALARAYGGEPVAPEVLDTPLRSLRALALDNAHEGCVRETFGALLATYQAKNAEDPRVRALMARIAEDETRHAQLSWQLMAWLMPRLSGPECEEVATEQRRARQQLAAEAEPTVDEAERRALGLPSAETWRVLLASMERGLAGALAA